MKNTNSKCSSLLWNCPWRWMMFHKYNLILGLLVVFTLGGKSSQRALAGSFLNVKQLNMFSKKLSGSTTWGYSFTDTQPNNFLPLLQLYTPDPNFYHLDAKDSPKWSSTLDYKTSFPLSHSALLPTVPQPLWPLCYINFLLAATGVWWGLKKAKLQQAAIEENGFKLKKSSNSDNPSQMPEKRTDNVDPVVTC